MTDGAENKRLIDRQPALRSAKVHFFNSVIDCLVLDFSAAGVRVNTELPIAFPETVTIELRTGAMWRAARRWQRGLETGFELLVFAGLNRESSARASALYVELRASGTMDALERLAQAGYFDSPALRNAALALSLAHEKLDEAFRNALQRNH